VTDGQTILEEKKAKNVQKIQTTQHALHKNHRKTHNQYEYVLQLGLQILTVALCPNINRLDIFNRSSANYFFVACGIIHQLFILSTYL